jgi:hypothetical protein
MNFTFAEVDALPVQRTLNSVAELAPDLGGWTLTDRLSFDLGVRFEDVNSAATGEITTVDTSRGSCDGQAMRRSGCAAAISSTVRMTSARASRGTGVIGSPPPNRPRVKSRRSRQQPNREWQPGRARRPAFCISTLTLLLQGRLLSG